MKKFELPAKIEGMRETLFDIVTDPPCHRGLLCEFWDTQGHFCFLKDMHSNSQKCELVNELLSMLTEHGVVVLDKDQTPMAGEFYEIYDQEGDSHHIYKRQEKAGGIYIAEVEGGADAELIENAVNTYLHLVNLDGTPVKEG